MAAALPIGELSEFLNNDSGDTPMLLTQDQEMIRDAVRDFAQTLSLIHI